MRANASALDAGESVSGPARILDLKGRKGINPTSIHTSSRLIGTSAWQSKESGFYETPPTRTVCSPEGEGGPND